MSDGNGNDELRSLVETNFKFLAITMRDAASRASQTEARLAGVQGHMTGVDSDLKGVQEGLRSVQAHLRQVDTGLAETADLTRQNREDFERMADRLDQAVTALGTLAESGTEHRQRFESIEARLAALEGKTPPPATDEAS